MSILLIIPPGRHKFHDSDVCLGFGYLAAILKKEGYDVKILNLHSTSKRVVNNIIKKKNPKIVGIRCLTNERNDAINLSRIIKKVDNEIKIVFGGPHATVMYRQLLNNSSIDYIILGEGEKTFLEVVSAIHNDKPIGNIKGVGYKKGNNIIKTKDQKLISNLDSLPLPSYNLNNDPNETVWISTSRGCMYNCGFCTAKNVWGRSCRTKSIKKIVDELGFYVDNFNRVYFGFMDDTFTYDKKRARDICKEIIKRKLRIRWSVGTRVDCVDGKTMYWMKKAGCRRIDFGVESGSEMIRENMNKNFKNEDIIRAFELAKKFKIKTVAYMILGYTGETLGTILQSMKLYNKIKPDAIITCPARLYPGTELYEDAKSQGLISDDYWLSNKNAPIYTGSFSAFNLMLITFFVTSYFGLKKGFINYFKYLFKYIYEGLLKKKYFRENFYALKE